MSKNRKKYLNLQKYRKKYGIRQEDMALLLGICKSAYSHKEIRISPFNSDEIEKMHTEFNKLAEKAGDGYLSLDEIFLD